MVWEEETLKELARGAQIIGGIGSVGMVNKDAFLIGGEAALIYAGKSHSSRSNTEVKLDNQYVNERINLLEMRINNMKVDDGLFHNE